MRKEQEKERNKERELHRHDFDRNFHFVSRTEGEIYARRTHTSLFGGQGPGRCLEGSVPAKTGTSKRANKTTPTRHLPVLPNAFDIDFFWGLPLSFPMFLETQVRRATVTSISRRAGIFNEGRTCSKFEKKVPGSCNRFQAWSCDSLRHRSRSGRRTRAPVRDTVFDMAAGNTWHCQQEPVMNDVVRILMWSQGDSVGLYQRKHAFQAWMIQFSFFLF